MTYIAVVYVFLIVLELMDASMPILVAIGYWIGSCGLSLSAIILLSFIMRMTYLNMYRAYLGINCHYSI